jgi:hypothetical protein
MYVTTYTINDGNGGNNYTVVTVTHTGTITPATLTITAVTETRDYDGTTNSNLTPMYSGLLGSDTVSDLSQAYASRNVHPAGGNPLYALTWTISDDNGGDNYTVVTPLTPGTIKAIPLTISATSDTRVYNGTVGSTAVPTVTGLVSTDTVTSAKEQFTSPNPMGVNGSTLFVSSYALNDGGGGVNYIVTPNTAPGTIYYLATKLAYERPLPTSGTAGVALTPTVKVDVQDAFGNVVTDDNSSTVTITLNTGTFDGGSNFVTAPVVNGVATFSGASALVIDKIGSNYVLAATDGALTSVSTPKISIVANVGTQLVLASAPPTATAGVNFQAVFDVEDAFGNLTSTPTTVTLTLNTGTFTGAFNGKSSATATNQAGAASFSSLQLSTAGKYTLTASASGIAGTPSFDVTVNPNVATKLVYLTQPTNAGTNTALPAFQIAIEDAFGNIETGDSASQITVAVQSGPSGSIYGMLTVQVVNGVATFDSVFFSKVGSYILKASVNTYAFTRNSNSFSIS